MEEYYPNPQQNIFHEPSYKELNNDEQEALEYYLEGGRRHEVKGFQGINRRISGQEITMQVPAIVSSTRESRGSSVHDRLIKHFKEFAPMTLQEGKMILDSAQQRLENAKDTKKGNPEAAIIRSYEGISGYFLEANEDQQVLKEAFVDPEKPDVELIRGSPGIHTAIARQLIARDLLWSYGEDWPSPHYNVYKERFKYWLGLVIATSRLPNDEPVVQLHEFATKRAEERFRALGKEVRALVNTENMPIVHKLIREGKLNPLPLRILWQSRYEELGLEPDIPVQAEPTDFDSMLPTGMREKVEQLRHTDQAIAAAVEAELEGEFEKGAGRNTLELARLEMERKKIGKVALSQEEIEEQEKAKKAGQPRPPHPKKPDTSSRRHPAKSTWIRKQTGYDKIPPSDDITLF
jgi:PAS domain-containing protein